MPTEIQRQEPPSPQPLTRGLVEVFTGNGKGKTSAALGVVLRALGHGLRVCIVYFMKGDYPYSEQKVLSKLSNVSFMRFGQTSFVDPLNIKEEERQQASEALKAAREAMLSGENDLVVLDEVNVASAWGLVKVEDVVNLIREKPEEVELILTGRYADARLIELGDVVTEMVEIKHPYRKGLLSRAGIDY
jgi:cob(I)alamin adenosyltransferase